MAPTLPAGSSTKEVHTSIQVECTYSYSPNVKETLKTGFRTITDSPDDPRWDGELMQPPFNGDPKGWLDVRTVTRVFEPDGPPEGEIVRSRAIHGGTYHKNKAQEFMRLFCELRAQGAEKPWDQDHFYRDTEKRAETLRKEGRKEEMELLRSVLQSAARPGGIVPAQETK